MEFFKNISMNLKAKGPAAVVISWMLCMTILGLFGDGEFAGRAMIALTAFGGALMASLGFMK